VMEKGRWKAERKHRVSVCDYREQARWSCKGELLTWFSSGGAMALM
jgi:hypothetical protein